MVKDVDRQCENSPKIRAFYKREKCMKDGWEKKDEFNQGYHDKVTNGKEK